MFKPTDSPTSIITNKDISLSQLSKDLEKILGEKRWEDTKDKIGFSGVSRVRIHGWEQMREKPDYSIVINYTLDGISGFPIRLTKIQEKKVYKLINSY